MYRYQVDHALDLWEHGYLWACVDNFKELISEAKQTRDMSKLHQLHQVLFGSYVLGFMFARHGDIMGSMDKLRPKDLDDQSKSLHYFWAYQVAGPRDRAWAELVRYCENNGKGEYDKLVRDLHRVLVDRFCDA